MAPSGLPGDAVLRRAAPPVEPTAEVVEEGTVAHPPLPPWGGDAAELLG